MKIKNLFLVIITAVFLVGMMTSGYAMEENCFDAEDNDGDGKVDCADVDCDSKRGMKYYSKLYSQYKNDKEVTCVYEPVGENEPKWLDDYWHTDTQRENLLDYAEGNENVEWIEGTRTSKDWMEDKFGLNWDDTENRGDYCENMGAKFKADGNIGPSWYLCSTQKNWMDKTTETNYCFNFIDDDGDGKMDCADSDCFGKSGEKDYSDIPNKYDRAEYGGMSRLENVTKGKTKEVVCYKPSEGLEESPDYLDIYNDPGLSSDYFTYARATRGAEAEVVWIGGTQGSRDWVKNNKIEGLTPRSTDGEADAIRGDYCKTMGLQYKDPNKLKADWYLCGAQKGWMDDEEMRQSVIERSQGATFAPAQESESNTALYGAALVALIVIGAAGYWYYTKKK